MHNSDLAIDGTRPYDIRQIHSLKCRCDSLNFVRCFSDKTVHVYMWSRYKTYCFIRAYRITFRCDLATGAEIWGSFNQKTCTITHIRNMKSTFGYLMQGQQNLITLSFPHPSFKHPTSSAALSILANSTVHRCNVADVERRKTIWILSWLRLYGGPRIVHDES